MTVTEFIPIFTMLQEAYDAQLTKGEVESYFTEIGEHDALDFSRAAARIPSNEPRTAYKPFPEAKTIRNYILDAKEGRKLREDRSQPKSVEQVLTRCLAHTITPERQSWAKLCSGMIHVGTITAESRRMRKDMIEEFLSTYSEWMNTRYEEKEWLQGKLRDCHDT